MIIRCPSCTTGFEIPDHVLGEGRKVRCNQCQHVWFADASDAVEAAATAPVSEETPSAPSEPAPEPTAPASEPAAPDEAQAAPIPAPTIDTSEDEDTSEDASGEEGDIEAASSDDGEEDAPESTPDEAGEEDGEQDQDQSQEGASLAATLAAMREEAENEDLDDDDDDDDFSIEGDHGLNIDEPGEGMSRAMLIGWISLPVFFVLVIGLFFGLHGSISQAWPPSNQIYGVFGLSSDRASDRASDESSHGEEEAEEDHDVRNDPGYDPKDYISMDYSAQPSELADGTPALLIRGTITNSAEFDIELAPMRGVLRNQLNQNVHQWDFELADSHVRAGGLLPFTTSVADPPRDMTGLEIFLLWPSE